MKANQILIVTCGLGLAMALTGCGMFGNKKQTVVSPVLPHDREAIAKNAKQLTYTPEEIKAGVVKGDWAIETVYGKPVVGETAPYLKFVPGEKRIYGNNGCNTINAVYTYNPKDSTISFSNMASTMRACATEGLTDFEINTALDAVRYYTWRDVDSNYYFTFYDADHREVMQLMHQNFDFLNGTWRVTRINDMEVNLPDMKLVIDVDELKIHGNTGCNVINGDMEIDMDQPNSISFSAIGMTRVACRTPEYETAMVVALEEAASAKPVNNSEVILYDAMHKPVMTLVRSSDN